MNYLNYLKTKRPCPFCNLAKEEIIKSNKNAILTLAKAPYTEDHLLIIPKNHYQRFDSLKPPIKKDMEKLIKWGTNKIRKKHENFSVLYREGMNSGKSIKHLHVHIIPKIPVGPNSPKFQERDIFSEEKYIEKIKEIKKKFKIEQFKTSIIFFLI